MGEGGGYFGGDLHTHTELKRVHIRVQDRLSDVTASWHMIGGAGGGRCWGGGNCWLACCCYTLSCLLLLCRVRLSSCHAVHVAPASRAPL